MELRWTAIIDYKHCGYCCLITWPWRDVAIICAGCAMHSCPRPIRPIDIQTHFILVVPDPGEPKRVTNSTQSQTHVNDFKLRWKTKLGKVSRFCASTYCQASCCLGSYTATASDVNDTKTFHISTRNVRVRDLAKARSRPFSRHSFWHLYILALFKVPTYAKATLLAVCYLCIAHEKSNSLKTEINVNVNRY